MAAYNFPNSPSDGDTVTSNGITYTYSSSKTRWDGAAPSGSSTTVYATIDLLPLSGASTGDQAFVSGNNRLYIWNGTGWYNIALINTNPSISGASATYDLAADGTATTVTITATDPEGLPITYSIASDTSGDVATVAQGTGSNTNVFTITPSTNTANAGTFSLTFRASDGVNIATAVSSFTLQFSIQNSNYTTALITSVGANNAVNNSFDDASTNNHTITANGNVTQNTFSPYRHGGYSTYFDGSGDNLTTSGAVVPTNGSFTVQCWAWLNDTSNCALWSQGSGGSSASRTSVSVENGNWWAQIGGTIVGTSTAPLTKQWIFVEFQFNGSQIEFFVNGTSIGSANTTTNAENVSFKIGGLWASGYDFEGYITDLKVISGTPSGSSTVPTDRLTATSGTEMLTCHLPYIADGSTNSHAITVNGNTKTEPWSPFDHSGYTAASHGGSMHFDGSGDYLVTGADADQFVNSSNTGTIEMWLRLDSFTSPRTTLCGHWTGSSGWTFDLDTAGSLVIATNGVVTSAASTGLTLGRWHHFAVVNTGSAINVFVDGIYKSTQSNPSVSSASSSSLTIGSRSDNSLPTNGIIADFRFVDGTAVYDRGSASVGDKVFTPPTAPLTAITNTALLLRGTDAAIIDKSQSVETITLNGDVKSSTTQSKYLTSSMYFDGSGDYLTIPSIQLGTLPFTIEMWVRLSVVTTSSNIPFLSSGTGSSTGTFQFEISSNSKLGFQYDSASTFTTSSGLTADTWHHVAISRAGTGSNETKLFLDGVLAGSSTIASNFNSTADMFVGRNRGNSTYASGYISDVRITKGLARYTSAFTPPSAALGG